MRGVGAALPRTSVGEIGGYCRQWTPRAAAKLPEAASWMEKQEEREWRGPRRRCPPAGLPTFSGALAGSIPVKAALDHAAHGHRLARGIPLHAGLRALQIRASWRRSLHGAPAASGPPPSPPGPPHPRHTPCTPPAHTTPTPPRALESQSLPSSSPPQEPGGSAGSAWPCVLRFPSWARTAHAGALARESPRMVGLCGPPRAGLREGPAVHPVGRHLLAARVREAAVSCQ